MSALLALQRDFQTYVLGQGGASPAIGAAVREQFGLPAERRLAIYYHAYRSRLRAALSESFDKTWTYLGDDVFAELADGYVQAHPSRSGNLRWFGADFAAHAARALPDYPFVAELAQFEWALGLAFDAADTAVIGADDLRHLAPQDWERAVFGLHPCVQLLPMRWNSVAIWQALGQGETPPQPEPADADRHWLVWRCAGQPHFRSLDGVEARALRAVGDGEAFAAICERAGADAAPALAGMLQTWLSQGVLCDAAPCSSTKT
ncbi:MAG: DNA-binding domain-containing protein [Pseudomonadota bacterium]